jgi:hypothetical protein
MTRSRQRTIYICVKGHKGWSRDYCICCRRVIDGKVRAYFRELAKQLFTGGR